MLVSRLILGGNHNGSTKEKSFSCEKNEETL